MKPDNTKPDEDGDHEGDCLSPIDEDGGMPATDGSELKLTLDQEPVNGTDGLGTDDVSTYDVGTYETGIDGVGTDGVDSTNAMRRHRHNIKEKERKEKIKLDMLEIQSLLPPSQVPDKRQTMHELLQLGIQHIRYLSEQNTQLAVSGGSNCNEVERLRKEIEELKVESSRYRALIASAGLPIGVDPSQLFITWRYRSLEEMNNPFLFAPNSQQMATNVLPPVSVDSSQRQAVQDTSQQFSGQIPYATSDSGTSQFMMYTDLLNSSDSSCIGLSANDHQNSFAAQSASLVSHNGQLMLVSQPQVPLQTLPVNQFQGNSQNVENQKSDQQTLSYPQATSESTIDRKQLEENSESLMLPTATHAGMAEMNSSSATAVSVPESSSCTNDLVQIPNQENNDCLTSLSTQNMADSSDQSRPSEMPMSSQEFFSSSISSVQPTMTANNSLVYSESMTAANTNFDPNGMVTAAGIHTSSSGALVASTAGGDGQLQSGYGQSVVVHNGSVLLVNQNQNLAPQPLGPSINGGVIGQDFSGGYCQNPNSQIATTNLPLQNTAAPGNTVFLGKPNQFGSQQMTFFPGQTPALPPALLQPPLASNQTVTVNTPQGPMIMHTLPSKPNEHPQALILPDGQIVPVVTQPNLLFPPQQCIPVTGSLLVPSMTPSRLAPGMISSATSNTLAAKLVDGKSQTFALPQTPSVQLNAGVQSFQNVVPQVLPGVDASKLCSASPLQAVPAQGHLPLPSLQSCSSASKTASSRSRKKPSTAATAGTSTKPTTLPQIPGSITAMVTSEGNILLIQGSDVSQNPLPPSHQKPAQRPLMPKPMPRTESVPQQFATAVAVSHPVTNTVSVTATPHVAPVNCGPPSASMMTPLTIALPTQSILPFAGASMPITCTPSTDILARATESLFTESPIVHNPPDAYSADVHENQLHIDICNNAVTENSMASDGCKSAEKAVKSKKKKNSKPKNVSHIDQSDVRQPALGLEDQHNLHLNFFSPGGKAEEEKESDITDFADLIRIEPATPAPAKFAETAVSVEIEIAQENADKDNSAKHLADSHPVGKVCSSSSSVESSVPSGESEFVKSMIPEPLSVKTSADTTSLPESLVHDSSADSASPVLLPVQPSNSEAAPSTCTEKTANSAAVITVEADSLKKKVLEKENGSKSSGKKTSSRKKKSQKTLEISIQDQEVESKTVPCDDSVKEVNEDDQQIIPHRQDEKLLDKNSEPEKKHENVSPGSTSKNHPKDVGTEVKISADEGKKKVTVEPQVHGSANDNESRKSEKSHSNHKEKKSGRSSKKEKAKAETPVEEETVRHNGKLDHSGLDVEESVEDDKQQTGSRKGFALSNFLPEACKPLDTMKSNDVKINKGNKRLRASEDNSVVEEVEIVKTCSEVVEKIEEATQTVRKELKSRNRDEGDLENRGKKRLKKLNDSLQEEMPEMLTFAESDIFDVVDKVENMAAATQTEPKRKSHSRKHKSSCERDGVSSKRMKKNSDKHGSTSSVITEKKSDVASSRLMPSTSESQSLRLTDTDQTTAVAKSNPMDVFSFEPDDKETPCCRLHDKNPGHTETLDNTREHHIKECAVEQTPVKPTESNGPTSPSRKLSFSASSETKSKPLSPASLLSERNPKSAKTSRLPTSISSACEVPAMCTQAPSINTEGGGYAEKMNADSVPCKSANVLPDLAVSTSQTTEVLQKGIKTGSICSLFHNLAAKTHTSSSNDTVVPYDKVLEIPPNEMPVEGSTSVISDAGSSKVSAGKAQHTNIVSLAGSLTPKSAVTKLTSHVQRSKTEREGTKETSTNPTQEADRHRKSSKECDSENRSDVSKMVPVSSAEVQHPQVPRESVSKETVVRESVDNLHVSKPDKQRTSREKEAASKNDTHAKNTMFSQESLATSNASHYMTSQPVLSQCAYNNDLCQTSHTPTLHTHSSATSSDIGNSLPSSRSGCSQKSSSMQTSSQSGMQSSGQPKLAAGYNSTGAGVELERKSWQEEPRRRPDPNYYAAVPSCAVQNKNSDRYSCSSVFTADKTGMTHQQSESVNFGGSFGSLAQNSFYPKPSTFGRLDQMSPCGGESMTRSGMSSCSVDKRTSNANAGNQPGDTSAMRRDMAKTNQHDTYYSSQLGGQFLEPTASQALSLMNRDKSTCLGSSMSSQTNSRQPVSNTSSTTNRNRSQNRSPSLGEQSSPYSALSGCHGTSVPGSLATTMLHHQSSVSDYSRYSNSQHSFNFDMFQPPGTQFNPNLSGLTFDPPPLNILRDCSSVSTQNNGVKKPATKVTDSGFETTTKSTVSRAPSHQSSNQPQSCKSSSNRSTSKSSSSSTKKSTKTPSYGVDSGVFDGRCVTPFLGLGNLSPSRTMSESLSYFASSNIFRNTGRTLSSAKTLQHCDTPLSFNPPPLFSPPHAAQNGLGLNFQTGFGMEHVHSTHLPSSQVIPPAANMPTHMPTFGFGNIFPDISGAAQRDALTMSPMKFRGGMEASTLHHAHHHGASSMYNGRGQLPSHVIPEMGFNPFLGTQHPGFDTRSIGTHFGSHGPAASFGMGALNFPMHNI